MLISIPGSMEDLITSPALLKETAKKRCYERRQPTEIHGQAKKCFREAFTCEIKGTVWEFRPADIMGMKMDLIFTVSAEEK